MATSNYCASFYSSLLPIAVLCWVIRPLLSLGIDDFYQLSDAEAILLPEEDDEIQGINLDPPFGFFGSQYNDLYVSEHSIACNYHILIEP